MERLQLETFQDNGGTVLAVQMAPSDVHACRTFPPWSSVEEVAQQLESLAAEIREADNATAGD